MGVDEIQSLIVEELAVVTNKDFNSLLEELRTGGDQWPCDSLILTEAVVVLEAKLGVELPMDDATASSLMSVKGLATRFHSVLEGVGSGA